MNNHEFHQIISDSAAALVLFYVPGTEANEEALAELKKAEGLANGAAPVLAIDASANPEEANLCRIHEFPTFVMYRSGSEEWRKEGVIPARQLAADLEATALAPGAQFHHRPGYEGRL